MPQREERRLRLARRQLLLAQIARREARHALAGAIAEEARSAKLAERSRDLLSEYATRAAQPVAGADAETFRTNLAFVRSLSDTADSAEKVHKDAGDQAKWQAQTLAAVETRMERHESRVSKAARALDEARERREFADGAARPAGKASKGKEPRMARRLQGDPANHPSPSSPEPAASTPRNAP